MDGLSAASSIIAVIQISSQVFDLCRTYYLNVRDARKDIQRLQVEINALQHVLANVVDLADNPKSPSLKTLNLICQENGLLQQCQSELVSVVARLEPREESVRMKPFGLRALKWPFTVKELEKILGNIEKHKSSFVLALTTDQTSLSLSIARDVLEITQKLDSQKLDDDREAILEWLCSTDPSSNYLAACKRCQPGSGRWELEQTEFQQWQTTRNSLLWLHGIPGSGKTILSSIIIQELQAKCNTPSKNALVYFYFDFNTTAKQDPARCLASIIGQICGQVTSIHERVRKLYQHHSYGKKQSPLHELKEMLVAMTEDLDDVFVVLDALDECPKEGERGLLLETIADILSQAGGNIHLLVTSRRERDIEEGLLPLLTHPAISIQGLRLEEDIKMYISWQLATDARLKKWSTDIKQEIQRSLEMGANGMFRWVDCQLAVLKRCLKVTMIRDALRNLPKTLDDTYTQIFLRIDEAYRDDAKRALMWLAFEQRPLQLRELAEATVIRPRSRPPFDPEERFPDSQDILEILSSLVTVTELIIYDSNPDNTGKATVTLVTLAHYSVQEYLISDRIKETPVGYFSISEITSNKHIAESCANYLLYHARLADNASFPPEMNDFPLLEYAATYWYMHANRLPPDSEQKYLTLLTLELLLSHSSLLSWSTDAGQSTNRSLYGDTFHVFILGRRRSEYALFYAVDLGLPHVVEKLLDRGWNPNITDDRGETALHRVARAGHVAIAKALMRKGAFFDARNYSQQTPFHWAAFLGNFDMVNLLLEWGADINAGNNLGQTALHFAASMDARMLYHLLGKGASLEVRTLEGRTLKGETPLDWATTQSTRMIIIAEAESREAIRDTGISTSASLLK